MAIHIDKIAIMAGDRNVTYGEMLYHIGVYAQQSNTQPGDKSIIFCDNCEGWVYTFYSIWMRQGIAVPVDASATAEDLAYIINDCQPVNIWTSRKKTETVREAMKSVGVDLPLLMIEDYTCIDPDKDYKYDAASLEYKGVTLPKVSLLELTADRERTAVIIYTSGTTGSPKGVMLSYDNILANAEAVTDVGIFNGERRTLMLLPVHHILPLQGTVIVPLRSGDGIIICPSLSGPDIMETMCRGKVAIMIGVPRLYQTLFHGMKKKIDAHFITRMLFWICKKVGSRSLSRTVFGSIRKKMGGHITYMVSGGAALDKEIGFGLKTLGLDVLEGYGMTEAAPIISFTRPGDIIPGCAGLPLPSNECKIVEGELWAKGRNIMQGYYNRPEETAAVITDGWLHTGDLATIDEVGHITITGRTKEIIVLSNGKNVNPAELEFKLEKYDLHVKEAAVVQDGDMLRAVIVPQKEWARGLSEAEIEDKLKKEVLQPYNSSVENYKKVMSLYVYDGDLPRTKMDKLQRFKIQALLKAGVHKAPKPDIVEPDFEEYKILKQYIMDEKHLDELLPTDNIETDLAFDSLDKISMQGFIEQTFGMKVTADQITAFANITAMAEFVADRKTRIEISDIDWHDILHQPATENLPDTWSTGPAIVSLFRAWYKAQFKVKGVGLENIPTEGPFIIAPNHQSVLDGMLVVEYLNNKTIRKTYFFAKEKHVKSAWRKWMAARHNIIVLKDNDMKGSVQKLGDALKQGRNIIIFPEGTRTRNGKVGEFKKMFAILAVELGVPVIPVCIKGAFEAMPRGKKIPNSHPIEVEFLPAIKPDGMNYEELASKTQKTIKDRL